MTAVPERPSHSLSSRGDTQGQGLVGDEDVLGNKTPDFHARGLEQPGDEMVDGGAGVGKIGSLDGSTGARVGSHRAGISNKGPIDSDAEEVSGQNQAHVDNTPTRNSHHSDASKNTRNTSSEEQKTTVEKLMRAYRLTPDTVSHNAAMGIPPGPYKGLRLKCWHLCRNDSFDGLMAVLVIISIALTGLEKDIQSPWMNNIQTIFVVIFALEFGVRFYGSPVLPRYHDNVLLLDAIVVVGSFVDLAFQLYVTDGIPGVELIKMLRAVRLFRVLMHGSLMPVAVSFLRAFGSIYRAMIPIAVIMYYYSLFMRVLLEGVANEASADFALRDAADMYFNSLPLSMMTLCEVMFGNFAFSEVITFPLVTSGVSPMASLLWISFEILTQILLLNFVTALVVEGSVRMGRADDELLARERMVKHVLNCAEIRKNFNRLDKDHDGYLTLDELQQGIARNPKLVQLFGIEPKDVKYLFEVIACGPERSKHISMEDFFSAVVTIKGSALSVEMMSFDLQTKRLESGIQEISAQAKACDQRLTILQHEHDMIEAETSEHDWQQALLDMRGLQDEFHRLSDLIIRVEDKRNPKPLSRASLNESYQACAAIKRLQESMEQATRAASKDSTGVCHSSSTNNFMQNLSREYLDKFQQLAEEEVQRARAELAQIHAHPRHGN